jgi:hypothetical protein
MRCGFAPPRYERPENVPRGGERGKRTGRKRNNVGVLAFHDVFPRPSGHSPGVPASPARGRGERSRPCRSAPPPRASRRLEARPRAAAVRSDAGTRWALQTGVGALEDARSTQALSLVPEGVVGGAAVAASRGLGTPSHRVWQCPLHPRGDRTSQSRSQRRRGRRYGRRARKLEVRAAATPQRPASHPAASKVNSNMRRGTPERRRATCLTSPDFPPGTPRG